MKVHAKPAATGFNRLLLFSFFLLLSGVIHAQSISGTVSDESGKKLSSISVTVKGSSVGTTTNAEGNFSINAASDATLTFSSV